MLPDGERVHARSPLARASPGRPVIYASHTFAGAILEILAHSLRPPTLPGPHHAARIDIPDGLVEALPAGASPGWAERDSPGARRFGDRWLDQARSAVLDAPSVPACPVGRLLVINPAHPEAARISVGDPFDVPPPRLLSHPPAILAASPPGHSPKPRGAAHPPCTLHMERWSPRPPT